MEAGFLDIDLQNYLIEFSCFRYFKISENEKFRSISDTKFSDIREQKKKDQISNLLDQIDRINHIDAYPLIRL